MKLQFLYFFATLVLFSCGLNKSTTVEAPELVNPTAENWDFCQCLVALDSITFAIESDKHTPVEIDKLMIRWEYVDSKCKEFTTFDNSTPQSRSKHEKRVKKCLEENLQKN